MIPCIFNDSYMQLVTFYNVDHWGDHRGDRRVKGRFAHTDRLLQAGYRRHVEASDDRHQGIEVADVEAFTGGLDPIFDDANALLLLRMLEEHGEARRYRLHGVLGIFGET